MFTDVASPPLPTISIDDVTVNEAGGNAVFTVTQSAVSGTDTTFTYSTADGTAAAPGDYTSASNLTGTITAGTTSTTISIPVVDDMLFEGDETFTVTLSDPSNATIATGTGTGTIGDDDSPPTVQFDSSTYSVNEDGTNASLIVTKSGATALPASVHYATSDGTATAGQDYTATAGDVMFAHNETSKEITVPITDDITYEGDEGFTVTLSGPSGATLGSPDTAAVTIIEDDALPLVQFSQANYDVNEADGTVTLTVTKTGVTATPATVNYVTSDGSATAGEDYTTSSGTIAFLPNETEHTFTVPISQDNLHEGNEGFLVTLNTPVGASLGAPNPATVTILDDDPSPSFTIDDVTQAEGNSSTTDFVFTVTKSSEPTALAATVQFATMDGSATTADDDYVAANGRLTFAPNETSKTITVQVNGDVTVEAGEDFTVELANPVNATIVINSGTGTICEIDDAAPVADNVNVSTEEDEPLTITLSASDADGDALTFMIVDSPAHGALGTVSAANCAAGSCTATVDYTPANGYSGPDSFTYKANDGVNLQHRGHHLDHGQSAPRADRYKHERQRRQLSAPGVARLAGWRHDHIPNPDG